MLGSVEQDAAVTAALGPLTPAEAAAAGLLVPEGPGWRAALDLRPYGVADGPRWWVLSDLDARRQQRDHVTGVGAASLTLAAATVRRQVGSVLDLGTGCGVQALHASRHARHVTGTDVAPRALALAAATFALNDVDVELLTGPWLAPVAGRRFDQIVSNPPFVPGPARVEFVYRDSGADGDAALAALVADLAGTSRRAAWRSCSRRGCTCAARTGPTGCGRGCPGCDAWVVQREVADPALHVGTWQRDGGLDPASAAGREQARAWLDWMDGASGRGRRFRAAHAAAHRRRADRGVRGPR